MRRVDQIEPIRRAVRVDMPVAQAFEEFVTGFPRWWPPEYTWSGDVLDTVMIEPRLDGRCFERGPHGFEVDWGRVIVWEPPLRLVFTWQITPTRMPQPNPELASEVDVQFEPERNATSRVQLEHRGFERHGPGGAVYREDMNAREGWTYLLERYAASAMAAAEPLTR